MEHTGLFEWINGKVYIHSLLSNTESLIPLPYLMYVSRVRNLRCAKGITSEHYLNIKVKINSKKLM